MRLGECTEHLFETSQPWNSLHNPEGIHRKRRQADGIARIPGTSQLNLLVTIQLLTHQRGTQHNPVLPRLQCVLKRTVVAWSKTAWPDMDDVEDNTAGTLTEDRAGQLCLQGTRPRPRTEIGQLRIQRRLVNAQQHHVIRRLNRATPLKEELPACGIQPRQQRQQGQGQQQ